MESDKEQSAACHNSPVTETSSVEEAQAAEEDIEQQANADG